MNRPIPAWVVLILMAVTFGLAVSWPPAQAQVQRSPMVVQAPAREPQVLSGSDIGFRVEGVDRAGSPRGTLVVRVNGEWVPVVSTMALRPLTK